MYSTLLIPMFPHLDAVGDTAEAMEAAREIGALGRQFNIFKAILNALDCRANEKLERLKGQSDAITLLRKSGDEHLAELLALLRSLVKDPHQTQREGLERIRAIDNVKIRAAALAKIAPLLYEPALREALDVAHAIDDEKARGEVMMKLALRLGELGYPDEALDEAKAIGDAEEQARDELASGLDELLPTARALEQARTMTEERARAAVLAEWAPHLAEAKLRAALEMAHAIGDEKVRAEAMIKLVPRLVELGYPAEAIDEVKSIDDRKEQIRLLDAVLGPLAFRLDQENEEIVASKVSRKMMQNIVDTLYMNRFTTVLRHALSTLAPHAADLGYESEALFAAICLSKDERQWAYSLEKLAPRLSEPAIREALHIGRNISAINRAMALELLAPRLAEMGHESEALDEARAISDAMTRAKVLVAVSAHLTDPVDRDKVQSEALATVQESVKAEELGTAIGELASGLTERSLRQALDMVRGIDDTRVRAAAINALAPRLSKSLLGKRWYSGGSAMKRC